MDEDYEDEDAGDDDDGERYKPTPPSRLRPTKKPTPAPPTSQSNLQPTWQPGMDEDYEDEDAGDDDDGERYKPTPPSRLRPTKKPTPAPPTTQSNLQPTWQP